MVRGYCVGGAFMPLLPHDFRIAPEDPPCCLLGAGWGLFRGGVGCRAVAGGVRPRQALYSACGGERSEGKEAGRTGMVNYAVPAGKLEAATIELAGKLMKKSQAVLRATKQAIKHVRTMDVAQAYDYLAEKGKAIKVADKEDSYNTGLRQFLA